MATVLDVSILQSFDAVFPFVFVLAVVFAILQKTTIFGKSIGVNATIAAVTAFMMLLSPVLIDLINFIIPWFVIAIIFFMLLLLLFQVFGATESNIYEYMKNDKAVGWVLVIVAGVIVFAGMSTVIGQTLLDTGGDTPSENLASDGSVATADFQTNIINTLRNPKILGIGILFAIAIFAVGLLSGGEKWG
ncbi:TPA: hypothetical protein HA278_00850 [Candidatus Woesearchaeota archaeon]|nr:hypothetical protein [archaeon]HIJ10579.1 hypothetical protein [Candidatus Woesearchaeota archaeon]|tara:strand:- start:163 stop:732 length:570 start_codon:yes stop_codon:yes gene_type:complete